MKTYKTGYYGIELIEDENGYYLYATTGDEQSFTNKPTKEEIDQFVENVEVN